MDILVIGAGAIGTFLGGVLTRAGHQITYLDLPPVIYHLRKQGIKVKGIGEDIINEKVYAVAEINKTQVYDLVIVAVKSYCTKAAIDKIPADIAKKIITFQNGIGNEEILAEKFGKERIISGAITYPITIIEPGRVLLEKATAGIGIAPMDPSVNIEKLWEMFELAGLNTEMYHSYKSLKWSKLLLNIICNASCAILGMTPLEIFADRRLVKIEREQVTETLRVMRKMGVKIVDLPGYPVKRLVTAYNFLSPSILKLVMREKIAKARGDKKPSLLLALENGSHQTEVDSLNGAVYYYANKLSMIAPVNKIIAKTLEDIAKGTIPWEEIKNQPETFISLFG